MQIVKKKFDIFQMPKCPRSHLPMPEMWRLYNKPEDEPVSFTTCWLVINDLFTLQLWHIPPANSGCSRLTLRLPQEIQMSEEGQVLHVRNKTLLLLHTAVTGLQQLRHWSTAAELWCSKKGNTGNLTTNFSMIVVKHERTGGRGGSKPWDKAYKLD